MSEMLGNQYFMARNYPLAQKELEEVISLDSTRNLIKKKLIICYTQTGRINDAIKLFMEIINSDISILINTDIEKDDCPCPELIQKFEESPLSHSDLYTQNIILGIIWLYCDVQKSLNHFNLAYTLSPNDSHISFIIEKLKDYLGSSNTSKSTSANF